MTVTDGSIRMDPCPPLIVGVATGRHLIRYDSVEDATKDIDPGCAMLGEFFGYDCKARPLDIVGILSPTRRVRISVLRDEAPDPQGMHALLIHFLRPFGILAGRNDYTLDQLIEAMQISRFPNASYETETAP